MRILVPVDPEDQSFSAAIHAADRLAGPKDEVHVLHLEKAPVDWYSDLQLEERFDEELERSRRSLVQALEKRGLARAKVTVARESSSASAGVGDAIVDFAKEIEADLIVIPTHGRKGFSRLVLGSVAERVVRLAHCDVHIVRIPRG